MKDGTQDDSKYHQKENVGNPRLLEKQREEVTKKKHESKNEN